MAEHPIEPWLRRFLPARRFVRAQQKTIAGKPVRATGLERTRIRVLSWNVAKNNYKQRWAEDFAAIVAQYNPDLILLQEVRFEIQAEQALELAGMHWHFAPNFIDAHHRAYSGILTAARAQTLATESIVTEHFEPIARTPKISLATTHAINDTQQALLTINCHLINFSNLSKFKAQLASLQTIIQSHRGPVILSGDFNTWSRSRAACLERFCRQFNLHSAAFSSVERQKIKRFLNSPPLDYIFASGLRENSAATVLDAVTSSDHKPLLASFRLAEAL